MNRKDKKNVDILFQNSLFEAISIKSHFNLSNNFSKIKISSLTAPNFSKHMQKRDKNNLSDEQQLHDNNSAADLHSRHDRVISFEEPASSLFPFGQQKNWNLFLVVLVRRSKDDYRLVRGEGRGRNQEALRCF